MKFRNGNLVGKTGRKILLGNSQEVEVQYDGSTLIITAPIVSFKDGDGDNLATFIRNAESRLYHNNSQAYLTTSTGGEILASNGNKFSFVNLASENYIQTNEHGAPFSLRAEDSGGTARKIFEGNPDAGTSLPYAGTTVFETISNGVKISLATNPLEISESGSQITLKSTTINATIVLQGTTSGPTTRNIIVGDPDGALEGYHAGIKTVFTGAGELHLVDTTGTQSGYFTHEGTANFNMINETNGGKITLYGTSSGLKAMAEFNPAGAGKIYYAGSSRMETHANGFLCYENTGEYMSFTGASSQWSLISRAHGWPMVAQGENSGGSLRNLWSFDPDGNYTLYQAGVNHLQSAGGYMLLYNTAGNQWATFGFGATSVLSIRSKYDSAIIRIEGDNAGSTLTTCADFDPNGAVKLKYAGADKFETLSNGSKTTGNHEVTGRMIGGRDVTHKNGNYTAVDGETILVSASAATYITLTTQADAQITIKKIDASGNDVIIQGQGGAEIDGFLAISLENQYEYVIVVCDGTDWWIVSANPVNEASLSSSSESSSSSSSSESSSSSSVSSSSSSTPP